MTATFYNSTVVTLADLLVDNAGAQLTTLRQSGVRSSTALLLYTYVSYLDAKAYAGTAQAADVVLADRMDDRWVEEWQDRRLFARRNNWRLRAADAGSHEPFNRGSISNFALFNPAFKIFTSPFSAFGSRLTQEQTGFIEDPVIATEPKTLLGFALGLPAIAFFRRRKLNLTTDKVSNNA